MYKTMLYLPDEANILLNETSKRTGISKSELIRQAVAQFLSQYDKSKLEVAYGAWKNREIDLRGLRDEWNR